MRFWRREDGIEGRSLESWLQPSDEFVDKIVGGINPVPRRSHRLGYRPALATGLTVVSLGIFGAFGGVSYAAKAVRQAVNVVQAPKHDENASAHLQTGTQNGNQDASQDNQGKPKDDGKSKGGGDEAVSSSSDDETDSPSSDQYEGKTTICHKTSSETNPWVLITVSNNAIPAHKKHGDTLPGAGGTCPGPPIP
jgi:hypothetical protein